MGALSLTGCSIAPTSNGAAPEAGSSASASSSATQAKSAAAVAKSAAATPAPKQTTPAADPAAATGTDTPAEADTAAAAAVSQPAPDSPEAPNVAPGADVSAAKAATAAAPVAPAAAAPAAAPAASVVAAATTGSGTQAATNFSWGPVLSGDEFSNTGAPDSTKWSVFKGSGHSGKGVRSPQAWSVANGVATVSGDAAGTTGGMSAKFAQQKYGRWETRMKTDTRDPKYHPVLILWPNEPSSNCAEIDYAEGGGDTKSMKFFLHHACGGSDFQSYATKPIDSTQWHNYAVEWTPAGITGYIDGVKTFSDTNPAHQPTVAMHQTLQLDWFPDGSATKPSQMQVDWVRVYK